MITRSRGAGRMRSLIGLVTLASLVASACGDLAPGSLAYTTEHGDPTILRIATPRIAGFEDVIEDWEREHPTVRVDIVVRNIDDHHRLVLDGPQDDSDVDLVAFDATYGPEIRQQPDAFADLHEAGSLPRASEYLEARWAEGIADDGTLIALPLDTESTALLVRTDLVDEQTVAALHEAESWCDLLIEADAFSDDTGIAFLANGAGLLEAILAQSRSSFLNPDGSTIAEERDELERAWDLAMIAVGEAPIHGTTCAQFEDVQRIARNLPFDDPDWRTQLRADGFAAIVAPWSARRRIANAAPMTADAWTAVDLPGSEFSSGSTGDGGLQLGLAANGPNPDLALDLLVTLTHPAVQEVAFDDGRGPLPSARAPHTSGLVGRSVDGFFGDASASASYSDAAMARPAELASSQRRLVIEEMLIALNKVQSGTISSDDAWDVALDTLRRQGNAE